MGALYLIFRIVCEELRQKMYTQQIVTELTSPSAQPTKVLQEPVLKALHLLTKNTKAASFVRIDVVKEVENLLGVKTEDFGKYPSGDFKFRNWVGECLYRHRRNRLVTSPARSQFALTRKGAEKAKKINFEAATSYQDLTTSVSLPSTDEFQVRILEAMQSVQSSKTESFSEYLNEITSVVKGSREPWGTTETITPAKAAELLEGNTVNRGVSRSRVKRYTREMKEGTWKNTGQGVILSSRLADGRRLLLNGQHTLESIIKSETTQEMLVVYDVPLENFPYLDRGKERNLSDVLSAAGVRYGIKMSGLYKKLQDIQNSFGDVPDYNGARLFRKTESRLDSSEAISWAGDNYQRCREAMNVIPDRGVLLSPASTFRALYYLFSQVDEDAAKTFFQILINGYGYEGDVESNPIYRLRVSLERLRVNTKRVKGGRMSMAQQVGMTIKAWNAWRTGRTYKNLTFKPNECMPEIQGLKA